MIRAMISKALPFPSASDMIFVCIYLEERDSLIMLKEHEFRQRRRWPDGADTVQCHVAAFFRRLETV